MISLLMNVVGGSCKRKDMFERVIEKGLKNQLYNESIIEEIDHDVFGLLVDESADVYDKEQMAVVFRFVDKNEIVKERFMGVTHVSETSLASLKSATDFMFAKYGLSIQKVREHG